MKGILFNIEAVRAFLENRKFRTSRPVKDNQFSGLGKETPNNIIKNKKLHNQPYCAMNDNELVESAFKSPYRKGDILYVRETWCRGFARNGDSKNIYKADIETDLQAIHTWTPSIHMPKSIARIFLKVTDVRVERLQEKMCDAEAKKEGVTFAGEFIDLWNSTIKKQDIDKYGWNANPYVWVFEFERCEPLC